MFGHKVLSAPVKPHQPFISPDDDTDSEVLDSTPITTGDSISPSKTGSPSLLFNLNLLSAVTPPPTYLRMIKLKVKPDPDGAANTSGK